LRGYDCGAFGSAEDIKQIREDIILNSSLTRYQVVVLDEFHVASKQAQSSLLKVLEEIRSNTFVLICTTDMDRVIETLKSRAIV
jgi:DNA polymerase-3 subunit gamma/tau